MREIKFRAWDKWSNKMVAPRDGDFIGWHTPSNWKECYEIMQFTGLHDKSGREMYEGDVYKQYGRYFVIEWSECGFEVRNIISGQVIPGYIHEIAADEECEYIGSIYENPQFTET